MSLHERGALFAVAGRPVLHSLSPQILGAALGAAGLRGTCVRLAAQSAGEALAAAKEIGLRGMNVTSPFKEDMAALVDELDPAARWTGAVNAVVFGEGRTAGHNTDVRGVSESLRCSGVAVEGREVLVLGTGGAAKAAVEALRRAGAEVAVAGRDAAKVEALADRWGAARLSLEPSALSECLSRCHVLVGCLSTAERVVPAGALRPGLVVMDAHYARESVLAGDARSRGCEVVDGREWLLHQAAASFRLFTGVQAPLESMRRALELHGPAPKPNIALVGFMGSGKDAVSRCLSSATAMPVMDCDGEIEKRAGVTVAEIFSSRGEEAFRDMESDVLDGLGGIRGRVVNCGGGAVLREANRENLRENCTVAWLWAGPETILSRIRGDEVRPLLDVEDRPARIRELISERIPLYAESSDLVVPTDGKRPEEIAERIADEVRQAFGRLG